MNPDKIAQYLPFLEKVLTPPRLRHSLGVMQVMEELAPVYQFDRQRAAVAGLLHDAAKDLPEAQWQPIVQEAGIQIRESADANYNLYLHGPVGAAFVQQSLGINDALILDAIRMHTYYGSGENFHHPLVWCLRFSDILEPNRDWNVAVIKENTQELRELAYSGQLFKAALLQTRCVMQMFKQQNAPVHSNYDRVLKQLNDRLKVDDLITGTEESLSS
jgi:predicted HD superfamily hydrolase involved in NAD metabolism